MSNDKSASHLGDVDAVARALYRRCRSAGANYDDVAAAVRRLHSVLKHLKAEAEDGDSALNASDRASSYQRKLDGIIDDCEYDLESLEAFLTRHAENGSLAPEEERNKLARIASDLAEDKLEIDTFLDTVQLQNPSKTQPVAALDGNAANLDAIKDKVDAIATRLLEKRDRDGLGDDEEELWRQFKRELEKDGFSKDILQNHKDVLRAYIRELETSTGPESGAPPTVRGLLEQEKVHHQRPDLAVTPASYPDQADWSPKEVMRPQFENEKFIPSIKAERRTPEQQPRSAPANQHSVVSYEKHSSDDDEDPRDPNSMALISTRDLISMDGLNAQMGALQLHSGGAQQQNYSISPTASSTTRYLPSNVTVPFLQTGSDLALSSSPSNLSSSPRYAPLPTYSQAQGMAAPPPYGSSPRQSSSRLGPDHRGAEIPLDAKWTRIKRSLVSPEVLERAGVRYEARPDFVAILGVLSRDEIARFAQQSIEARARRGSHSGGQQQQRPPPSTFERRYNPEYYPQQQYPSGPQNYRPRDNSDSSRHSDEKPSVSFGAVHGEKNGHPQQQPHPHEKGGGAAQDYYNRSHPSYGASPVRKPSVHSDSDSVLWDESDTDEDDNRKRSHSDEKRRPYFIVPAPGLSEKHGGRDGASPAATVQPKPILKNKNENHVRFDPEPYEIGPEEANKSPPRRSSRESDRERERERDQERDRRRPRRDRQREYYDAGRDPRERERERERDRERGDREYNTSSSSRRHREYHRDRDRDRDGGRDGHRREREKKKWAPTIGAMGIGGAAGSLLSVLTEAASGL